MRRFTGTIRTDISGSECDFVFEVEDNATKEEIEETAKQTAFSYVDWNYKEELN